MLASQAENGDLRVWSVSKPAEKETPRTIRMLKKADATISGPQFMAWSKNGKIIQYIAGYVKILLKYVHVIANATFTEQHGPGMSGQNMLLPNAFRL